MKTKYKEIYKLKKLLEEAGIPFEFREGYGYPEEVRKKCPDISEHYQVCYPCFADELRVLSAIEGFGTYGAEQDLLEIMGLLEPEEGDGMVAGYLSAENVFNRIKNHYEGRINYMKTVKSIDEDTLEMKDVIKEENLDETFRKQVRSALNCKPEEFAEKYAAYKKAEAEFKELYEPFKTGLLNLYNGTPELPKNIVVGGVKVSYVSPSIRSSIDSKKLKEEEPEIAKKFTKTTEVSATIRLEGI